MRFMRQPSPLIRFLMFALGAAVSVPVGIAAGGMILGMVGPVSPLVSMALVNALLSAALLILSIVLLRQEGPGIAALGLPLDRSRIGQCAFGFVVTMVLFFGVIATQSAIVGASWEFQGMRGVMAAITGLTLVSSMVLAEELFFRGVGLRSLRAICGDRTAIVLSALAFGAYHLLGSGHWAMGAAFQFLMPTAGGLLFGWAAIRSGGLALPIGLHLGGNWVQACVAAFVMIPETVATEPVQSIWRIPITAGEAQMLAAPDVLPRLPYMMAFAVAALLSWYSLRQQRDSGEPGHLAS
jgi:membrane protease YdiL (CAAX protease family)